MARPKKDTKMTWKAAVTMPPDAGEHLERIAVEMGVQPAVAIRILLLEKLRERAAQEGQMHKGKPYNWVGAGPFATPLSQAGPHEQKQE